MIIWKCQNSDGQEDCSAAGIIASISSIVSSTGQLLALRYLFYVFFMALRNRCCSANMSLEVSN